MTTREMMTREIISNSCNTILLLLLLLICNYVSFIFHLFIRTYKFILHLCNCRNSTKCLGEGRGVSTRSTRHPPLRRTRSRRRRRRRGGLGPVAPAAVRGRGLRLAPRHPRRTRWRPPRTRATRGRPRGTRTTRRRQQGVPLRLATRMQRQQGVPLPLVGRPSTCVGRRPSRGGRSQFTSA